LLFCVGVSVSTIATDTCTARHTGFTKVVTYLHERKTSVASGGVGLTDLASNGLVRSVLPVVVLGGVEVSLSRPVERLRPRLVAHPVANEIHIAGVDQYADAVLQHGHEFLCVCNKREKRGAGAV